MKIAKKGIALFLFGASIFFADSAMALTKWTSPPKPSNVPIDFEKAVMNLTNWSLGFVSLVAVLVIIWGGVQYLTSAGRENQTIMGKDTIKYGLMGLAIAGLAYASVVIIVTVIF